MTSPTAIVPAPVTAIVLAIDTAAPRLQLALLLADGRVDVSINEIAQGHAELIFSRIADLLARNAITYADLTRVAVTSGPGSFTGLRIGLSAARGIGLARAIPVVGVPSLQAISLAGETDTQPIAVLLDARREEAYFQLFSVPGIALTEAAILPMADARAQIPAGTHLIESPFVDIALVARFAADLDPALYDPEAHYVRNADAKPQDKARITRVAP